MLSGPSVSPGFNEVQGTFDIYSSDMCLGHNGITDEIYLYWKSLCSGGHLPTRSDIKLRDLQNVLSRFVMMDVEKKGDLFKLKIRLMGTYVADHFGEQTGKYVTDITNVAASSRIMFVASKVIETKKPYLTVTPGFDEMRQYLQSCALYLPLFNADGAVDKVWACLDVARRVS